MQTTITAPALTGDGEHLARKNNTSNTAVANNDGDIDTIRNKHGIEYNAYKDFWKLQVSSHASVFVSDNGTCC